MKRLQERLLSQDAPLKVSTVSDLVEDQHTKKVLSPKPSPQCYVMANPSHIPGSMMDKESIKDRLQLCVAVGASIDELLPCRITINTGAAPRSVNITFYVQLKDNGETRKSAYTCHSRAKAVQFWQIKKTVYRKFINCK